MVDKKIKEVVVSVEIEGNCGLLMHRFSQEAEKVLKANSKRASKKKTPEEEAEDAAYRISDGSLCIPAEAIFQAMVLAASAFKITGRRGKTYKDSVKGYLAIAPEYIPLLDPHSSKNLTEYQIDSRPARIQSSRVIRHRPLINHWRLKFDLRILDDSQLPIEECQNILEEAGRSKGLLDYRPRYGKYSVVKFEPKA